MVSALRESSRRRRIPGRFPLRRRSRHSGECIDILEKLTQLSQQIILQNLHGFFSKQIFSKDDNPYLTYISDNNYPILVKGENRKHLYIEYLMRHEHYQNIKLDACLYDDHPEIITNATGHQINPHCKLRAIQANGLQKSRAYLEKLAEQIGINDPIPDHIDNETKASLKNAQQTYLEAKVNHENQEKFNQDILSFPFN